MRMVAQHHRLALRAGTCFLSRIALHCVHLSSYFYTYFRRIDNKYTTILPTNSMLFRFQSNAHTFFFFFLKSSRKNTEHCHAILICAECAHRRKSIQQHRWSSRRESDASKYNRLPSKRLHLRLFHLVFSCRPRARLSSLALQLDFTQCSCSRRHTSWINYDLMLFDSPVLLFSGSDEFDLIPIIVIACALPVVFAFWTEAAPNNISTKWRTKKSDGDVHICDDINGIRCQSLFRFGVRNSSDLCKALIHSRCVADGDSQCVVWVLLCIIYLVGQANLGHADVPHWCVYFVNTS